MTVREIIERHPRPPSLDRDVLLRCIDKCFDCAATCTSCADACLGESDVPELVRCVRLNLDCADVCEDTGRVVTRQTEPDLGLVRASVEACVVACRACAEECDRHAPHHDHCRVCAEVVAAASRRAAICSPLSADMIPRATQFFESLSQIVEAGGEGDRVRLSTRSMQLVAVDGMAATVAGLATGAPVGGRVEVGRPEALGVDAPGRRLFAATADERTVIGDPQPRYFGTELHGGELTPGHGARIGMIDFETWFATHPQGARR